MTELARVNVGDGGYGQNQLILSYELVSQSIKDNSSFVKLQVSLYCPVWINTTQSKLKLSDSTKENPIAEIEVGPNFIAGTHVLWTNGDTGWELGHNEKGVLDYTFIAEIVSTFLLSGKVSSKLPIPDIPRYATANQSLNSKTENAITMNWSSDSTIDYIWYSTNNGSTWKGVDVTDGTSGTYKITGLSPNTSYNIKTRVRRKDSQLTTDSTALAVTTYKVPTNALSSKTETKVTVNWSVDSTADYIWYSINNGSSWVAVGSVNATSGSYAISNLSPNTAYTIKTRVRRKATQTTYDTSAISVTTYKAPTNTLKSKTETSITMNWSADSTVDYIWYSKDNGTNWTGLDVTDGTSGSYTISGLSANTAYNIKTRIRRKATQTTYDCSTVAVTTYNYPYIEKVETSNLIIGNSQKITLYNPLGRTVTIRMHQNSINGTQLYGGTTSGTSLIFTPTASTLYASIPSAKSSKCVYSAIYSTSTKTTVSDFTYSINEANCKPTFSDFAYYDADGSTYTVTGNNKILVDNQSNVTFTVSTANKAVGKNSASITQYKFEWGTQSTTANYSADNSVSASIANSSGNILKVTAIDSRGLSTTVTKTITNVAYIDAVVNSIDIQRLNGVDIETYLGLKLTIWKGNWQNGTNTTYDNQLKYVGYRVYDGSSWTSYFDITSSVKSLMNSSSNGNTTTITVPLSKQLAIHANGTSGGFTIGKLYTIQVLIKDGTTTTIYTPYSYQATKQGTVPDGKVGFARFKDSDGNYHYAINSMPEKAYGLKVIGDIFSSGDIRIPYEPSKYDGSVPYCGGNIKPTELSEMSLYKTYLGSVYLNNKTWLNMISTRHRNGDSDGKNYGMMLYSYLTSNGSLFWNKQINSTTWQGERTILDSGNYNNYALPKSGGDVTGSINITTAGTNFDVGYKQGGEVVLRHNPGGATVLSAKEESIVFRPYGNSNTTNQASLDKNGNLTAVKFTGPLNGNATTATNSTKVDVTNSNPSTGTVYYPTFVTGAGTGAIIRANNGFQYYSLEGTTGVYGRSLLTLGNQTATGTAGNKRGELKIFSEKTGCTRLHTVTNQTADCTVYLPEHGGYLHANVSLYHNDTGATGSITLSESSANFSYIEIFYKNSSGVVNSTKVYTPNGKTALLETAFITKESSGMKTIQHQAKTVLIGGTSITNTGTNPYIVYNVSHNGTSGSTWTDFTNSIQIIKVIGIK